MPVFTPHDQPVVHSGEGGSEPSSSPYYSRCDSCRPTTTTTTTTPTCGDSAVWLDQAPRVSPVAKPDKL